MSERKLSELSASKAGDPYRENPQAPEIDQVLRNLGLFMKSGHTIYPTQRSMYTFIKDWCRNERILKHPQYPKYIWKPKIADVGCGTGIGSNILSQEADFVWGIDKAEKSINFAREMFERQKNNIYYTPQISFDVIDILDQPRTMMEFDVVVSIEVIEHVEDYQGVLEFYKRLCKKDKSGKYLEPGNGATTVFISTPNRNCSKLDTEHPKNRYHVREWRVGEFYDMLIKNFKYVTILDHTGKPVDLDYTGSVVLAMCETPL
jgi:2-polyprenyl-3-methyl-5-hydroxy-6-metoxy-1,4-benzoquinol methylase